MLYISVSAGIYAGEHTSDRVRSTKYGVTELKHMETTVFNPQKGRLETINVDITAENTTWFEYSRNGQSVATITDFGGGLLLKKNDYSYPIWLYDISRADIDYSKQKANKLVLQFDK
jgi:hypothetical protein